ncbi:hypothetical protein TeGR_g4445, partial [Tetraparma gracilis]
MSSPSLPSTTAATFRKRLSKVLSSPPTDATMGPFALWLTFNRKHSKRLAELWVEWTLEPAQSPGEKLDTTPTAPTLAVRGASFAAFFLTRPNYQSSHGKDSDAFVRAVADVVLPGLVRAAVEGGRGEGTPEGEQLGRDLAAVEERRGPSAKLRECQGLLGKGGAPS